MTRLSSAYFPLAALIAGLATSGGAFACDAMQEALSALQEGDTARLLDLAETAETAPGCTAAELNQIDRWVALGLRSKALNDAQTYAEAEPDLETAAEIAQPWQLLATLGDAARERQDFVAADRYYQDALQDMLVLSNPSSPYWDRPPSPEVAQSIKRKADSARLAADTFQPRRGRPACQIQSNDLWSTEVVTPIRFVTAEATFTDVGARAAEDLYQCLSALDPSEVRRIRIIGHTDPRGEEAYNQALSEARAKAVYGFLIDRGLQLPLEIVGRGETEPFEPDDPNFYSQDLRLQMDRRVEVDVERYDD